MIKNEVFALEAKVPRNCLEIVDNIKRYIKIIENNEKNSVGSITNKRSASQLAVVRSYNKAEVGNRKQR